MAWRPLQLAGLATAAHTAVSLATPRPGDAAGDGWNWLGAQVTRRCRERGPPGLRSPPQLSPKPWPCPGPASNFLQEETVYF